MAQSIIKRLIVCFLSYTFGFWVRHILCLTFFYFFLHKNVLCIIFSIIFERSEGHND